MTNPTPEQQLLSSTAGELKALSICLNALLGILSQNQLKLFVANLDELSEHAKAVTIPTPVPDLFLEELETTLASKRSIAAASLQ